MILVTGGAGYIGGAVCKALHKHGYEHVVLDDLSRGCKEFVKWGKLIVGDIGDKKILEKIFSRYNIEAVIHLAAFIDVGESVKNPAKYYENNFCKTLILLKLMIERGVKNMIFSSSAAVYGIPKEIPITEEHELRPINPYGESKLFVENALKRFERAHGLKYISLRYFNAAGATGEIGYVHKYHLIPRILDVAIGAREFLEIYGTDYETKDGTCVRDYIHIDDLAEAHVLALEYLLEKEKSDVFNLGCEHGYSVKEVVEAAERVTGVKINTIKAPRREGDPPILVASKRKASQTLGWNPKKGLREILESSWRWHKKMFSER